MEDIRVLVVDDEPMMREISVEILRAFDFQVLEATNGTEALDVARSEHPDVVLLDIMMPELDGRDVCRAIKNDPSMDGTKVVLNSSLLESEVDWKAVGADGYRQKNQDLRGLPNYLRGLLN